VHLREQTRDRRLPGSRVAEDPEERDQRTHLVLDGLEADEGVQLLLELGERASGLRTRELVVHPVDQRVAAARGDRDAVAKHSQATPQVLDGVHTSRDSRTGINDA
jgi:hypothetical protein